jgi:hydrogenase maturation protein HypF
MIRYSLLIKGIVQGVGFRPYVYRLAKSLSVRGFVQNTPAGVYAEIEGDNAVCDDFITALEKHPPVSAQIHSIQTQTLPLRGDMDFAIIESGYGKKSALISPDIGICDKCAADIADKNNRRYRYAFTNCSDCGPRFTIIEDIPYDRKNTAMSGFVQCPDCLKEYEGQENRRFHAQPNACPVCGPQLSFYKAGKIQQDDPFLLFDECINNGGIAAVKGLGGYNLVCDAANYAAVGRIRNNKIRYDKPFA